MSEYKNEYLNLDNTEMLTREQYNKIVRADTVKKVNQFLRGMGTIFVVLVYFLMAEFLFETTLFSALIPGAKDEYVEFWNGVTRDDEDLAKEFSRYISYTGTEVTDETAISNKEYLWIYTNEQGEKYYYTSTFDEKYKSADYDWLGFEKDGKMILVPVPVEFSHEGKVFDDWFKWGTWIPKAGMSAFLVILTVGILYIIAFSINDIVGMIKNLLINSKKTIKDIGQTATTNVVEGLGLDPEVEIIKKPKKLLEDDIPALKETSADVLKTPTPMPKPRTKAKKDNEIDTELDAVLNGLLTHPHTEKEQALVEKINSTSTEELLGGRIDTE